MNKTSGPVGGEISEAVLAVAAELAAKKKSLNIRCEHVWPLDSLYGDFVVTVKDEDEHVATRSVSGSEFARLRFNPDAFVSRVDAAISQCTRELLMRHHARLP